MIKQLTAELTKLEARREEIATVATTAAQQLEATKLAAIDGRASVHAVTEKQSAFAASQSLLTAIDAKIEETRRELSRLEAEHEKADRDSRRRAHEAKQRQIVREAEKKLAEVHENLVAGLGGLLKLRERYRDAAIEAHHDVKADLPKRFELNHVEGLFMPLIAQAEEVLLDQSERAARKAQNRARSATSSRVTTHA